MRFETYFKIRIWWLAPYLLSILPIWFLLSRAAYEYSLQVTFFAGFAYYYLRYRTSTPKAIIPAIICGSLSFYSYTPGQIVMVVIGLLLLITDWKYHWLQRKTNIKAAGVFVLMLLPLIRFFSFHPAEYTDRLLMYNSYLVSDVSIGQKILQYFQIYFQALNPLYWFLPNQVDNPRFLMLGYAHLTWWVLPFLLAGIGIAIRFIRKPEFRFLLLALLAAPAGTALVKLTVHRVLVIVVPVVFLSLIAMHYVTGWVLNRARIKTGLLSFFLVIAFSAGSLVMLMDAINHGSTWYKNYGISGMQYGAMQVFTAADTYQQSHPEVTVYISPNWTFQSERVREFFIHNDQVKMGTVDEAMRKQDPEISKKVFVLLPDELQRVQDSGLFSIINEEMEIPYPDGSRGFTFVHLEYADNVDEVFARLRVQSTEPVETSLVWMGQQITAIHSPLDMGPIEKIMDGDTKTLVKTKGNNPLKVDILFSQPVRASGVVFSVGAEPVKITVGIQRNADGIAHEYTQEADVVDGYKDVIVDFGKSMEFQVLQFELLDTLVPEDMPVHLWEMRFLP